MRRFSTLLCLSGLVACVTQSVWATNTINIQYTAVDPRWGAVYGTGGAAEPGAGWNGGWQTTTGFQQIGIFSLAGLTAGNIVSVHLQIPQTDNFWAGSQSDYEANELDTYHIAATNDLGIQSADAASAALDLIGVYRSPGPINTDLGRFVDYDVTAMVEADITAGRHSFAYRIQHDPAVTYNGYCRFYPSTTNPIQLIVTTSTVTTPACGSGTMPTSTDTLYTVYVPPSASTRDGAVSGAGGATVDITNAQGVFGSSGNAPAWFVSKYKLSDFLPPGTTASQITSAFISIPNTDQVVSGNPFDNNIVLQHFATSNDTQVTSSDYDSNTPALTNCIAVPAHTAFPNSVNFTTVDVLAAIQDDLNSNRAVSSFRIGADPAGAQGAADLAYIPTSDNTDASFGPLDNYKLRNVMRLFINVASAPPSTPGTTQYVVWVPSSPANTRDGSVYGADGAIVQLKYPYGYFGSDGQNVMWLVSKFQFSDFLPGGVTASEVVSATLSVPNSDVVWAGNPAAYNMVAQHFVTTDETTVGSNDYHTSSPAAPDYGVIIPAHSPNRQGKSAQLVDVTAEVKDDLTNGRGVSCYRVGADPNGPQAVAGIDDSDYLPTSYNTDGFWGPLNDPKRNVMKLYIDVCNPPTTIAGISTTQGNAGSTAAGVQITGTGFVTGTTPVLSQTGMPDIVGTNINVTDANTLTADFVIPADAPSGLRNVVIPGCTSSSTLPNAFRIKSCVPIRFDDDGDGDVDMDDFAVFQACYTGTSTTIPSGCSCFDTNADGMIDATDFAAFEACATGPDVKLDANNPPAGCTP